MRYRSATFRCGGSFLLTEALLVLALVVPVQRQLWLGVRPLVAQEPTTRVETLPLLKRIAEALDGYRTGVPMYVVANREPPHTVHGVFETMVEARRVAATIARRPDIFGPYPTTRDPVGFIGCIHRGPSDMTQYCPLRPAITRVQVDSMSLIVHVRGQLPRTVSIPRDADALFLSSSAIDKFAMPYYSRLYGPDSAAAMRRAMLKER